MHYTDTALIEAYVKRALTIEEVASLTGAIIPAVDRWIDNKCDTTFKKVESTTRTYDGGERSLDIEPCTEITKVEALDYTGASSYEYTGPDEYQGYPLNETVKNELVRRHSCWPGGDARIAVTAKFSSYDDGVPEDIIHVATVICSDLTKLTDYNSSNVKSESLEGHSVTYTDLSMSIDKLASGNPLVKSILEQHTELLLG